jgi:hypothetical protein
MDPGQTRREGDSTPFPGQDVGETGEKPENGLRLMNYYSTTTKNTFFKKTQLTVLKTLCYLKKK